MDPSAPDPSPHSDAFDALIAASPPAGGMDAPAARRNAAPLRTVLSAEIAGVGGPILEVGSGTGQHAVAFAAALAPRVWLPTETDTARMDSIRAWRALSPDGPASARPLPPRRLDAANPAEDWPVADLAPFAAMLCVNVIHIAPWQVACGLFAGAARWLMPGAPLILYGPFHRDGNHTGPGNAAFDADLRSRDPNWGIRDLEREVVPAAASAGLSLAAVHALPANNLAVVLRR